MKRVLIITYYWPPSGGAGVQRWLKMTSYLAKQNITPIVITVLPGKASYPVRDESLLKEIADKVEVHHTSSFEPLNLYKISVGKNKIPTSGFSNVDTNTFLSKVSRWIRGNFFLPDARKGWNKYAYKMAEKVLSKNPGIKVVITTGPPHSTHLIGLKLKPRYKRIKWIADFRDPWTDIYYYDQFLHTAYAKRIDKKLEYKVLKNADRVLAVCESNLELFKSKLPDTEKSKVKLIMNGFDENDFIEFPICENRNYLEIVYTGTIADSYDVFPVLKAFKNLKIPWRFSIAGVVTPLFWKYAEELKIKENINYIGYVSHEKSLDLAKCADVLLHLSLEITKIPTGTSGKLLEYFAISKPILNIGPLQGDPALLIAKLKNGKSFLRNNVDEITSFLEEVYQNPNWQNLDVNVQQYSRKNITNQLIDIINSLE